jgi:hypothetical protein
MRFEKRYDGITYAIALKPRGDDKKLLGKLKIEIYRRHPSGEKRGHAWEVLFFDRELRARRYEYSDLGWCKSEVSIRAEWLEKEKWYLEDAEKIVRELGVKGAAEHILSHLKIVFDHPLSIPLRL